MKSGAENRNKTIISGALIAVVGIALVVMIYNAFFSGSSAPPTPQKPVIIDQTTGSSGKTSTSGSTSGGAKQNTPGGIAAGVDAQKLASTSSSLDPTLDESAMLRTESLVYSGTGRNIFSATYTPPPPAIKVLASARPKKPEPPPLPPVYVPPPPPPINLKFFGTTNQGRQGPLRAFLLSGEDVYLASEGDIVAHKYKVGAISANSVTVTDLQNNNTQTLPRLQN